MKPDKKSIRQWFMRQFAALIIAYGLFLSPFPLFHFIYTCTGEEVFPYFFANPFIHSATSLATSLALDYYLWGMAANLLIYVVFLNIIIRLGKKWYFISRPFKLFSRIFIGICLIYSGLTLFLSQAMFYRADTWMNLEEESKAWGMDCKKELHWFWE